MNKKFVCTKCGNLGFSRQILPGHIAIEFALWLLLIIPGLIYSIWRLVSKKEICRECGSDSIIPANSPVGKKIIEDMKAETSSNEIQKSAFKSFYSTYNSSLLFWLSTLIPLFLILAIQAAMTISIFNSTSDKDISGDSTTVSAKNSRDDKATKQNLAVHGNPYTIRTKSQKSNRNITAVFYVEYDTLNYPKMPEILNRNAPRIEFTLKNTVSKSKYKESDAQMKLCNDALNDINSILREFDARVENVLITELSIQ